MRQLFYCFLEGSTDFGELASTQKNMKINVKYLDAKIEETWCPRGEIRDWGWRAAASELLSTVAHPRETHASMLSEGHLFKSSGNVHFSLK